MSEARIVLDRILDSRLALRQPSRGHRAGTDAVLLAAAAAPRAGERVVDVGAGVGTVGLILAMRVPDLVGSLLERDPETAELARDNCRLNGVAERLAVVEADLFDAPARRQAGLAEESATLLVTNPPFLIESRSRMSPDPGRARAHGLDGSTTALAHGDWLRAALALLAPKGRMVMIHRPDALPTLLDASTGRLGDVAIIPVHAKADGPAVRILISGRKGSRAPMRLEPALVLHDATGRFTPEVEGLHRGEPLRSAAA